MRQHEQGEKIREEVLGKGYEWGLWLGRMIVGVWLWFVKGFVVFFFLFLFLGLHFWLNAH